VGRLRGTVGGHEDFLEHVCLLRAEVKKWH
jgi:hypothetical protein